MNKQTTMKMIAKRARVSTVTVSRALKNHPGLRPGTCKRIQKIATEMGYRPNPMLSVLMASLRRSQASQDSPVIAFLFSNSRPAQFDDTGLPLGAMLAGAKARAAALGYKLERFQLNAPGMTEDRMRRLLRARGILGAILAPLVDPIPDIRFDWSGFACATIGRSYVSPALHRAVNDQFSTMQLAVQKLLGRGYRRLGLAVHQASDERTGHRWSGGFLSAPLAVPDAIRLPVFTWTGEQARSFAGWLRDHRPDAIITLTPHVRRWLDTLGKRMPEDVGLIDLDLLTATSEISGINRRHDLLGGMAVDLVAEQLHLNEYGVPARPKTVMLMGDWIEGATLRNRDGSPRAHSSA